MAEITNVVDDSIVMERGSQGIEIFPGPQIVGYNPRKWQKLVENSSFADASIVVYRGSQCIEILPGPQIVCYNP